jgi:hypothetical protein
VIGGMLAATVIAIFVIPATFYVSRRLARAAETPAPESGSTPGGPAAGPITEGEPR